MRQLLTLAATALAAMCLGRLAAAGDLEEVLRLSFDDRSRALAHGGTSQETRPAWTPEGRFGKGHVIYTGQSFGLTRDNMRTESTGEEWKILFHMLRWAAGE